MDNIAAGIVSYNPDICRLKENINSIKRQIDCLLIVDNGSHNIDEIDKISVQENIVLIKIGENKGIAYALNKICEYFYKKNYNWVITLDQDSVSPQNLVLELSKYISYNIGIIGPQIIYRNNEDDSELQGMGKVESVQWIITSASLTNIRAWYSIGGFDEKLFIDSVDKDFCLRLKMKDFKVLRVNNIGLIHELGNLKCQRILGKNVYVTHHSPQRKRYMTRNCIYLKHKLGYGKPIIYITKLILKVLFFEKKKYINIKSIFKGVYDGIRGNTGKIHD